MEKQTKKKIAVLLSLVILITFIAFSPTLDNGFISNLDDNAYILSNEKIRNISENGFEKIFLTFTQSNYHPLTTLSNAIELKFFGLHPEKFHAVNLILHLFNVFLVFYFIFLLTNRMEVAIIVSALFGIHPMHVESVAWISERKDVLYSFFYLAGLISYLFYLKIKNSKEQKFLKDIYFVTIGFFLMSLLSKSAAVSFPLILLLIDFYRDRKFTEKSILEKIPFFVLSIIFGAIALYSQNSSGSMDLAPDRNLIDKIFIPFYSLCFYLYKLILPINQSAFYFYPTKINNLLPLIYYLSVIPIGFIILGIWKTKENKKDLIFGTLFFLSSIILVLQILPVGYAVVAERYTYLSYLGLFFILGQLYCKLIDRKNIAIQKIAPILLLSVFIFFSFLTYKRTKVWKDGLVLFTDVIKKNPTQSFAYYTRGTAKEQTKDHAGAIADFSEAILFQPDNPEAYNSRGVAKGMIHDFEGAINDFSETLRRNPEHVIAYLNRGSTYGTIGNFDEALSDFDNAIRLDPSNKIAYYFRAVTKDNSGKTNGICNDLFEASTLNIPIVITIAKKYCK